MKLGFSQQQIIDTAKSLGLPTDGFIQRRVARAFDLVESNKVTEIDDGIFRVRSQFEENKSYIVNVNHGQPSCDCPDGERTCHCKHRIASMLWLRGKFDTATPADEKERQAKQMRIRKRPDGIFCWIDGNTVGNADYNQKTGHWYCGCMRFKIKEPCKHVKEIQKRFGDDGNGGNGSKLTNECGTDQAKALQDKLNGQLDSRTGGFVTADNHHGNGNGANKAPSQQLDLSDPFQESEQNDIDQIEGRRNGELAWKLSNGEYCISYKGVMKLAEKHNIDFPTIIKSQQAVIAYAQKQGSLKADRSALSSTRLSGKPVRTYDTPIETVCELAKRNAARQLLPLPEIKAVEKKVQLENEFDWQKAQAKCAELVGRANVDIIIWDLVSAGKLRQDNPSHYNRTEWLIIHDACQRDAEIERDPESINNWSRNSAVFLERCREAIEKVADEGTAFHSTRAEKKAKEAVDIVGDKPTCHEQPLEGNNHKRKLQMDKKLRTWLIEADGTKKEISGKEICETFEDGSLVTRLRAGIDSGADISTVELDN